MGETFGLNETILVGIVRVFVPGRLAGVAHSLLLAPVELVQKISEAIRNALADDVVIDPLQDVAEPTLVFAAQASSGLSYLGIGMHSGL
jgi:hypothetical protein